jgi:HK97 family phage portal protein
MNLLQRIGNLFEKRSLTDSQLYNLIVGGNATYAGPSVNEDNAMRSSAVYACIRIISESIASLPLVLYKQQGRNKNRAVTHPLYPLLHDMANPEMTAFEWRELMMAHALLRGNGYSEKDVDNFGVVRALWPLRPDKMEDVRRGASGLEYVYRLPDNNLRVIPGWRIHHIKGLGDGLVGYSPIQQAAKQAVGLSLAAEEYGARFYGNGARPGLILKHPGKLSPAAAERLKASFASEHQGLSNAHRTKILEEGMDVTTIGIPNNEAQFLETRKFQVTEIARIYRVPPHMLADLDRATFSNIEQQSINFVIYTLMPWLVRHEQAIYRDLLNETERKTIFAKYIVEGMLRGDALSRYQSYQLAINNTILTPNEIRELEDRNPVEGGDKLFTPMNMMELGATPPQPTPVPAQGSQTQRKLDRLYSVIGREVEAEEIEIRAANTRDNRQRIMQRNVRLWEDAGNRLVKREIADIRKALPKQLGKRSVSQFETWLEGFYNDLRAAVPSYFDALMTTYAEEIMADVAKELDGKPAELNDELREWIAKYLENIAAVYAVGSHKQLNTLLAESESEEDAEKVITQRLEDWEGNKAQKLGFEQSFEAGNALAIFGYVAGGVSFLRWAARGESCPLCRKMDGRRIKIGSAFLDDGDEVTAEGANPLPIIRKVKHGPLHQACDCVTIAG